MRIPPGARTPSPGEFRPRRHRRRRWARWPLRPGGAGLSVAELGQPSVVGLGPGHQQVDGHVGGGGQSGAERRRCPTGHRVGVGEDDLADDPVGIELLVAAAGVPSTPEALGIFLFPLLGELLVAQAPLDQFGLHGRAGGQVLVEGAHGIQDRATRGTPRWAARHGSRPRSPCSSSSGYLPRSIGRSSGDLPQVGGVGAPEHRVGPGLDLGVDRLARAP